MTTQSAPSKVHLTCDLSEAHSFYPFRNEPTVPVLATFGKGNLHQCRLEGKWDWERAIAENPDKLIRSFRQLRPKNGRAMWDDVIFQFGDRRFLCGDPSRVVGYWATAEDAEKIVTDFDAVYAIEPPKSGGRFQLIRQDGNNFACENVSLDATSLLDAEQFELQYPAGTLDWHLEFLQALTVRKSGLSILEGRPGTGKTSYLRHLMGLLKESHRFYFIPPSNMAILSSPNFIAFWAEQRQRYSDERLVVILEDADAAVMTRATDNQEQVSALLNLSDGMLGDFLALQMICTINCSASEIDQALLRPGRLMTHRVFHRLEPARAEKLATALGRTLPRAEDYSLAEIFAGGRGESQPARRQMGFC